MTARSDIARVPAHVDLATDIWRGREGDEDARRRVEESAREQWPGARWGPFADPPVGARVRLPAALSLDRGGDLATVVGLYGADPDAWPRPHGCPSCACPRVRPSRAGWWEARRDKDGAEFRVYPPSLEEA